jgi:hypothetical protein
MKFFDNVHLTGAVLAVLACGSVIGCSRNSDSDVMNDRTLMAPAPTTESSTYSTTHSVIELPTQEPTYRTTHKTTYKAASKAKVAVQRRTPRRAPAVAAKPDDSYFYESELMTNDPDVVDPSQERGAVDATRDFDSVSGTTRAPITYSEGGLSPFAQEPFSRFPTTIGSGQLTGEDKSTTIFDEPGLFQDPSALGRELMK